MKLQIPHNLGVHRATQCVVLLWFLSTPEGRAWFTDYLESLPGHPSSTTNTGVARWAFFDDNPKTSTGCLISSRHRLCVAALESTEKAGYFEFLFQTDVCTDEYYGRTMFLFLGDLVVRTDWYRSKESEFNELIAGLKKVKKVMNT